MPRRGTAPLTSHAAGTPCSPQRHLPPARFARATTHPPLNALPITHTCQVTKYQEQPQLLDPLLEDLVKPLAGLLLRLALAATGSEGSAGGASVDAAAVADVSRFLWLLSTVRCERTGPWHCWGIDCVLFIYKSEQCPPVPKIARLVSGWQCTSHPTTLSPHLPFNGNPP